MRIPPSVDLSSPVDHWVQKSWEVSTDDTRFCQMKSALMILLFSNANLTEQYNILKSLELKLKPLFRLYLPFFFFSQKIVEYIA